MFSKGLYRTILCLLALFILCEVIFFSTVSYDTVCFKILSWTHKEYKLEHFKTSILPKAKYLWLVWANIAVSIIALLLVAKFYYKMLSFLAGIFKALKHFFKHQYTWARQLKPATKFSLALILLFQTCAIIFFIITTPVFIDEAFTFINFTKNGFFVSISYYPAPNNHIFYSLLTNIASHLPFSPLHNMRLVNLLVGIFTGLLFFKLLQRVFSDNISLLLTAIFNFSFMVLLYAVQARGYELVLFFFLFMANIMFSLIPGNKQSPVAYHVLYVLSSVLGFYTMPSFLYPFLTVNIFVFIVSVSKKNFPFIKNIIVDDIAVAFITVLLYAPIIAINGLNAVINNKYTHPLQRTETIAKLPAHIIDTANWLFPLPYQLSIALIITSIFILLFTIVIYWRNPVTRLFAAFFLLTLILPPVVLLLQSVIPFPRTWIYLSVPVVASFGFLITPLANKKPGQTISPILFNLVLVALMVAGICNFKITHQLYYANYYKSEAALNKIPLQHVHVIATENVDLGDMAIYKILVNDVTQKAVTIPMDSINAGNLPDLLIVNQNNTSNTLLNKYTYYANNGPFNFYLKNQNNIH